jgi:hypothetical protein
MRQNRRALGVTSRRKHGCNGENRQGWNGLVVSSFASSAAVGTE